MTNPTTPKWQMVENVVAAIERVRASVPGIEVIQKAQVPKAAFPEETRDVDVLVTIPVQGRIFLLGIEVKNEGRPIAEDEFGTLLDIKNELQLDRYCVVSTSGFTETARAKAARNGIELSTLNSTDGSAFFAAPPGELVMQRRVELVTINVDGPPEVTAKLQGKQADLLAVIRNGERRPLLEFAANWSQSLASNGRVEGRDGEEVEWRLEIASDVQLLVADELVGHPVAFDLRVRFRVDSIPDIRFELAGLLISAHEMDTPNGRVQCTMIGVPADDNPDIRKIYITTGPAKPTKQKVESKKLVLP